MSTPRRASTRLDETRHLIDQITHKHNKLTDTQHILKNKESVRNEETWLPQDYMQKNLSDDDGDVVKVWDEWSDRRTTVILHDPLMYLQKPNGEQRSTRRPRQQKRM